MTQKITIPLEQADRPSFPRTQSDATMPMPPLAATTLTEDKSKVIDGVLELADRSAYCGFSFGAEKSISGECVFQTGFVPVILYS